MPCQGDENMANKKENKDQEQHIPENNASKENEEVKNKEKDTAPKKSGGKDKKADDESSSLKAELAAEKDKY